MTEVFQWVRSTWDSSASPQEVLTSFGSSGNIFNWTGGYWDSSMSKVRGDDPVPANYADYPLYAYDESNGGASVEVWLRVHITGTYTAVTNIKFWIEEMDLSGYGAGAGIYGRIESAYPYSTGPEWTHPAKRTPPESYSTMIVGYDNGLDITPGTGISPGGITEYSNYAVLQLLTGIGGLPGKGGETTFVATYDVS